MTKLLGIIAGLALVAGCATAPKTQDERATLEQRAQSTLETMTARDANLQPLLDRSAGYVVFPDIGKGGALVGGAFGRGVVYENGQPTGFASLNQASIGAQLGAQTFAQLIVFRDQAALEDLKGGRFDVSGNASAVILTSGAAAATQFGDDGVAYFIMPRGGAMIDASVAGQQINFQPAGG